MAYICISGKAGAYPSPLWPLAISPRQEESSPAVQDYSDFHGGPKGPPYPKNYPKILM